MIKLLGPMMCSCCSSFEAAHHYLKQTARKQNFTNLPLSLAKRHQLRELVILVLPQRILIHSRCFHQKEPLVCFKVSVSRKETTCAISSMNQHYYLVLKIWQGFTKQVGLFYLEQNTVKNALLQLVVVETDLFQYFDSEIRVLSNFVYFEVSVSETRYFCNRFQVYRLTNIPSEITQISPYENLVDYNVFRKKESNCGYLYVSVRYYLDDILEEYNNFRNPL